MSFDDGFDFLLRREDSLASNRGSVSSLHVGIVTAVNSGTKTAFVRIPALNESAALGPYICIQPFTTQVETPVKQTLNVTTGTADGVSVVTGVSLSSTTTDIQGVYGVRNLPSVGDRVVVLLINDSLDEGVVIGKL